MWLCRIRAEDILFSNLFPDGDGGHSFDQVLFYGHETTLIIFEVLFFNAIDLFAKNYILSAVILYLGREVGSSRLDLL